MSEWKLVGRLDAVRNWDRPTVCVADVDGVEDHFRPSRGDWLRFSVWPDGRHFRTGSVSVTGGTRACLEIDQPLSPAVAAVCDGDYVFAIRQTGDEIRDRLTRIEAALGLGPWEKP